uniref:Uncharacterized protein n=1 Tax=Anguilla anguilla TaxID=7936 RepID=A0A0E9V141_ANGAN
MLWSHNPRGSTTMVNGKWTC